MIKVLPNPSHINTHTQTLVVVGDGGGFRVFLKNDSSRTLEEWPYSKEAEGYCISGDNLVRCRVSWVDYSHGGGDSYPAVDTTYPIWLWRKERGEFVWWLEASDSYGEEVTEVLEREFPGYLIEEV